MKIIINRCTSDYRNFSELQLFEQTLVRIYNFLIDFFRNHFEYCKEKWNLLQTEMDDCSIKSDQISLLTFSAIAISIITALLIGTISVICLIIFGTLCCSCLLIFLFIFIFICGPCFWCCVKTRVKMQRKREKDELLQGLLEQKTNVEIDGEKDGSAFAKMSDLSFFNLNYEDYKIERDIGTGGSGALCFEAIEKRVLLFSF